MEKISEEFFQLRIYKQNLIILQECFNKQLFIFIYKYHPEHIYNRMKNSTDRHFPIMILFQLATDKTNQPTNQPFQTVIYIYIYL